MFKSVNYSPCGRNIVTTSDNGTLKIYDVATCQLIRKIEGCSSGACSASYSPDGKHIAVIYDNGTVSIWDSDNGKLIHSIEDV